MKSNFAYMCRTWSCYAIGENARRYAPRRTNHPRIIRMDDKRRIRVKRVCRGKFLLTHLFGRCICLYVYWYLRQPRYDHGVRRRKAQYASEVAGPVRTNFKHEHSWIM